MTVRSESAARFEMTAERLEESAIFDAALRITTAAGRRAYVEKACGRDSDLYARIHALLQVHEEEPSFLSLPTDGGSPYFAGAGALLERPGSRIGPYTLREPIGEGGFGSVFRADQEHPVRRVVALKILKPGMETRQIVARFEAERQALALMDHPHIAGVLDGGETAAGRPYFVMELVDGTAITAYCDEHRLTPRERLALFIPVCQAVQHAHQKGVIHRDLKPSNVLVTSYDGRPTPKVIDFGIAKALGQPLTDSTLVTGAGSVIGTLEYMSPEQAGLDGADIDTRADIYSLGVMLYELLTGTTPLTRERVQSTPFGEVLRLIREEEPPRPSTRLGQSRVLLSPRAECRSVEPVRRAREVRGELDWIVMRALEKDRTRRYESASALARDLERYLHDEPVEACPPSTAYRLRKLARRHRRSLVAAVAFIATLAVSAAVSTWQAIQARAAQRGEASQRRQAETVLRFVQDHVFAAARPVDRPGGMGPNVSLRKALDSALEAVESNFATEPVVAARVRMTLGMSYWYLGEDRIAADQFRRAGSLFRSQVGPDDPDTLASMHHLANACAALGNESEAFRLRQETLARRAASLGPEHVDTLRSRVALARSYVILNRFRDALKLDEGTVSLLQATLGPEDPDTLLAMISLASDYKHLRRFDDAVALLDKVLAIQQRVFGRDHLETLSGMIRLANAYNDRGRHAEAVKLRERALALQRLKLPPDHPDLITSMYTLANGYGFLERYDKALELHREALSLRKAKYSPDHPAVLWSTWGVAAQLFKLNRGAEALPMIEDIVNRAARLEVQPDLIGLLNNQRNYYQERRDVTGCRKTAELWEKLRRADPRSLYNAACYRAVTAAVVRASDKSPSGASAASAEADRAMAWLQQAIAGGYDNLALLKKDADLDVLRDRADFRELLARLETSSRVPASR
jgi:serine/threonine protein kinase/tetratricopeptide (TPR) repeat protein